MNTAILRHHPHALPPHVSMTTLRRILTPIAAALLAMSLARSVGAQEMKDSLNAARDLYASAAYDEALNVLNRMRTSNLAQADATAVQQVRALCLLALGRSNEAQQAIEEVVAAQPMYQPTEADASPRVRAAFIDVRRRMLPTLAQQQYALAKNAYEHKDYASASRLFKKTMEVLDDPAVAQSKEPGLADLKTLTSGFLDLSLAAVAAAAVPPAQPVSTPDPTPAAPTVAKPAADVNRVYFAGDAGVIPPVAIRQDLPRWPLTQRPPQAKGVLEVVVDEDGTVESATMRESVSRVYDSVLLSAVKNWKYRPATRAGQPVRFRKLVQITLDPGR
jgi:TonB family protein